VTCMRRFLIRLLNVLRPNRAEQDLARELNSHVSLLEDEHRRRGMTPDEARLAARRAMGSVALAKHLHRDARSFVWLEDLRRDVKHAVRTLVRVPAFTASVVLTLALGIGANTAIFSVVNAVLLRPLPYPDADRLVYLMEEVHPADGAGGRDSRPAMDVQTLAEFRTQVRTLSAVGVQESTTLTMSHGGEAVRLIASRLSAAYLPMLGARPLLGRTFENEDEQSGAEGVVILSHAAWQRYFDGASNVIGEQVRLDGRAYSVVGVLSREFLFYPNFQAEMWTPYVLPAASFSMLPVVAKLRDGVSIEAARAETTTILKALRGTPEPPAFSIIRVQDQMVAPVRVALIVLSVTVGFVLLISCVNVANLLLARTATRQREIAVRGALGASTGRIARLFLTESLVLAVAGSVAAMAIAFGGIRLLHVLGTSLPRQDVGTGVSIPRLAEVGVDGWTLLFALAMSLMTGLVFGLASAMQRHHAVPADALRSGATCADSGRMIVASYRFRGLLVVAEVALAMVILVGAALMLNSFIKLAGVDTGYDATGVVTFQVTLPEGRDMAPFAEELVTRLRSTAGVRVAGYAAGIPMDQTGGRFPLRTTPTPPQGASRPSDRTADPRYVSEDYLDAMGIRVVDGRGFAESDRAGSQQVMLINRSLARSGMVDQNPIGTRVYALFKKPWEIVGVVDDVRQGGLDREPRPQFFIDFRQVPEFPFSEFRPYFAVRMEGDVTPLLTNLRGIIRQVESRASVDNVATMDQIVWNSISRPRLYTVLLACFAIVAVVLAIVGIFGLLAYLVAQRAREIGIRMALGAPRSQVISGVLRQTAVLIVIGVGIGLAAAMGLTRYLEGMLFGLTPLDPVSFVAASLLFLVVALLAAYVPARRATRVDPTVALRAE
jgi:predicted permease